MLASHEPVARHDCLQTKLAPDGRSIFCVSMQDTQDGPMIGISMLDPANGTVLYHKDDFFHPNLRFLVDLALSRLSSQPSDIMFASFSQDGNLLLIGPGADKLAFDLRTRAPIAVGGGIKSPINGAYTFIGNDRVLGVNNFDIRDSGIFSFPDGRRLANARFGLGDLESVTSGNYVLSRSAPDFAIGLADVSAANFILGSKTPAMDVWNDWLLNENPDGSVSLRKLKADGSPIQRASLSLSPLASGLRSAVSPDGRLFALSTRTRAGVWDIATGEQILLCRGFNSAVFNANDSLYAEFPKFGKLERQISRVSFTPTAVTPVAYKLDDTLRLAGGVLQEWKPGKKGIDLIVHDVHDNSILWQRTFPEGEPAHTENLVPGQTIFSFPFKTEFAKDRLKSVPGLERQATAIKDKDTCRLIQVVDNATGAVLHEFVIAVPLTYGGVFGLNFLGDLLYVTSDDNRTMVYDVSTGNQLRQFFGFVVAVDPATGHICTVNRRDQAVVLDAQGQRLADFQIGSEIRVATFQQAGNQLVLLTADQILHRLQIPPEADGASITP
jgi:WD40 repeat protein